MSQHSNVLITGVNGLIGSAILQNLQYDYNLSGLDLQPSHNAKQYQGNIANLESILPAFKGQENVVHLAADSSQTSSWESVLPNNIVGTFNVFEACRINGVKRVIFASSNHATGMYERDHPNHHVIKGEYNKVDVSSIIQVSHKSEIRPDGYYGISKAYGEAMGRYYSEEYGISVICLRIGTVNEWNNPTRNIRHFATWQSHRDLEQLVRKSLEAPTSVNYDIFYGVSNNKWRFWDTTHSKNVIGYAPQDNAEDFRKRGLI